MKRKMYRISLVNDFTYLTQSLVLMAARSNGGKYKSIDELKTVGETLQLSQPDYIVYKVHDNLLHIDYKAPNSGKLSHILSIEEVEVFELDMPEITQQEAKDLLDEISGVPTIDQYLKPQGLADNSNHELLN